MWSVRPSDAKGIWVTPTGAGPPCGYRELGNWAPEMENKDGVDVSIAANVAELTQRGKTWKAEGKGEEVWVRGGSGSSVLLPQQQGGWGALGSEHPKTQLPGCPHPEQKAFGVFF